MSALVRVTEAPHEGLIVCPLHQREVAFDLTFEKLHEAEAKFWGQRCLMCGIAPVLGRVCENERCGYPLAPCWPAVYCCNACAREDM